MRQAIQKEGKDVSILEMDPNKSYASQKSTQKEVGPPLKDDPEYQVSSAGIDTRDFSSCLSAPLSTHSFRNSSR